MRILFIIPFVPSRVRVRSFSFIRELSQRHEIHLFALAQSWSPDKAPGEDELQNIAASVTITPHANLRGFAQSLLALTTSSPMYTAFCWSRPMSRAIADAVRRREFDVVHIEHLRAAHFASSCGKLPVVFDQPDCITCLMEQMHRQKKNPVSKLVAFEEVSKLHPYESRMLARFNRVTTISEGERENLLSVAPGLRIDVISNGVDAEYYAPQGAAKSPHRLIFHGKMSFSPNEQAVQWFARNVFGALRERYPDAEFVIVGSAPTPAVLSLAETPGISVTGFVDDVRPHLDASAISVAPMQVAAGMQSKAMEAMAMGLPVVATPLVARPFRPNSPGLIVADSAEDMIREITRLFDSRCEAERIGAAGREEVRQQFSWISSARKLETVYTEAIRDHKR